MENFEITKRTIRLENGETTLELKKFNQAYIPKILFKKELSIENIIDEELYKEKVVKWCYPEYEQNPNKFGYRDTIKLYNLAINENTPLKYEQMLEATSGVISSKLPQIKVRSTLQKDSDEEEDNKKQPEAKSLTELISELDFKNFENIINANVIGQENSVKEILDWFLLLKYGAMMDDDGVLSLYLMGPSGVGKTTFVKTISEDVLKIKYLTIPGSQYGLEHKAEDLFGSPKGYVGYDSKGGILTKFIKENPTSIILLDEADKIHPKIYDRLTNFLDRGLVTTPNGTELYFKGCVFFTSNKGNRQYELTGGNTIGFSGGNESVCSDRDREKNRILKLIENEMPFELIGRIKEFVLFDYLNENSVGKILDSYVEKTNSKFKTRIELTQEAKNYIISEGFNKRTGARNLHTTYKKTILQPLVRKMQFEDEYSGIDSVLVDYDGCSFNYDGRRKIPKQLESYSSGE